jgi:integrase
VARNIHKLSSAAVKNAKPGMHADGGGLYLQATKRSDGTISKSWIFRFALKRRERHMGLGSLADVGLAQARKAAAEARKLTGEGIDPLDVRAASRAAAAAAGAKQMTFDEAAAAYIAGNQSGWGSAKHARQWSTTLGVYASPVFGNIGIRNIDTALVLKVIEPMWNEKRETAYRVRGRIENVLDWARARGYRAGENPARWRGHLDHILPGRPPSDKHHAALPYGDLPAFLKLLRAQRGVGPRALEFTILTAARSGEVTGATMSEIKDRTWIIPAARMKAGKEHRVPLSDRALAIIDELAPLRGDSEYLFPGIRGRLSDTLMRNQLWRMKRRDITVHGFRSTFSDWAAECTAFPNEAIEIALAHATGNRVERAYRRGDLFEKIDHVAVEGWRIRPPARPKAQSAARHTWILCN